jgi:hypothetical protein
VKAFLTLHRRRARIPWRPAEDRARGQRQAGELSPNRQLDVRQYLTSNCRLGGDSGVKLSKSSVRQADYTDKWFQLEDYEAHTEASFR